MSLNNFEDYNEFVTTLLIGAVEKSAIEIETFITQLRIAGATENTILY